MEDRYDASKIGVSWVRRIMPSVSEGESGAAVAKIDEKVKTAHQKEKRKLHDDVVAGQRAASDVEGQISLFDYMQFGG